MENLIKQLEEQLSPDELEFFKTLAPSYQKNFTNHAFSGKREETRLKNTEEVKGALELKCKNIFDYKKKLNPRNEIPKDLDDMSKIKLYFEQVVNNDNKSKIENLYFDIIKDIDNTKELYAWNSPMITYNETFICAFSVAKNHFSIGLINEALLFFEEKFLKNDYELLKKGIKIKWNQEVNKELLYEVLKFSIEKKKDAKGFWK